MGAMVLAGCQSDEPPATTAPGVDALTEPAARPSEAAAPANDEASAGDAAPAEQPGEIDPACLEESTNPFAESIAGTYEVAYADVMAWYCAGYSFDNVLIALETSKQTATPVETLLDMNRSQSWEAIWSDLGFVPAPNE